MTSRVQSILRLLSRSVTWRFAVLDPADNKNSSGAAELRDICADSPSPTEHLACILQRPPRRLSPETRLRRNRGRSSTPPNPGQTKVSSKPGELHTIGGHSIVPLVNRPTGRWRSDLVPLLRQSCRRAAFSKRTAESLCKALSRAERTFVMADSSPPGSARSSVSQRKIVPQMFPTADPAGSIAGEEIACRVAGGVAAPGSLVPA